MNTISWMMSGGLSSETGEDRRRRQHLVALREAAARDDRPGAVTAFRTGLSGIVDRLGALSAPAAVDPDRCCAPA